MTFTEIIHSFAPIADENSKILILGSMPSVASLEAGMYYSHKRNAFWRILADITGETLPIKNEEKKAFLLKNRIAVWDTLSVCEREGSLDSNIVSPMPNDVKSLVLKYNNIKHIFLNGGAANTFYKRYQAKAINLPFQKLPSTSPANARGGYEKKFVEWKVLKEYLR